MLLNQPLTGCSFILASQCINDVPWKRVGRRDVYWRRIDEDEELEDIIIEDDDDELEDELDEDIIIEEDDELEDIEEELEPFMDDELEDNMRCSGGLWIGMEEHVTITWDGECTWRQQAWKMKPYCWKPTLVEHREESCFADAMIIRRKMVSGKQMKWKCTHMTTHQNTLTK